MAVEKGNIKIIKLLLTNKSLDINTTTIFFFLNYLLHSKLTFFYMETPLFLAVKNGNIDIIKLLLTVDGIDVNIQSIIMSQNLMEF